LAFTDFLYSEGKEQLQKSFKPILVYLGVCLLVCIFYLTSDYAAGIDNRSFQAYANPQNSGDKSAA